MTKLNLTKLGLAAVLALGAAAPALANEGGMPPANTKVGNIPAVQRGARLYFNYCIGCHSLDPKAQMTGPTWYNIGNTAVGRQPGVSPAAFLDHSVVNPSEYVVPNYPDNIMPKNFGQILSIQDQGDLIAYLLQQTQGAPQ